MKAKRAQPIEAPTNQFGKRKNHHHCSSFLMLAQWVGVKPEAGHLLENQKKSRST